MSKEGISVTDREKQVANRDTIAFSFGSYSFMLARCDYEALQACKPYSGYDRESKIWYIITPAMVDGVKKHEVTGVDVVSNTVIGDVQALWKRLEKY